MLTENPFDLVKASDFNDKQIQNFWVDMPGESSFESVIKPRSAMPMIIKGGKGSGKTHLMRYFSYQLQKIRAGDDVKGFFTNEKYIGIYIRCTGLNAHRFNKPNIQFNWSLLFAYYFELWVAQVLIDVVSDYLEGSSTPTGTIINEIFSLFDKRPADITPESLMDVKGLFGEIQRDIDYKINNSVMDGEINVTILASPGKLVFGIPKIFSKHIADFSDTLFVYLVDELENFDTEQQKYVQTLVREKELPSSIKIGVRSWGIKTLETLSGGEVNKEGSEFEYLKLDNILRENPNYSDFAKKLCYHRLIETGVISGSSNNYEAIGKFFCARKIDDFTSAELSKNDTLDRLSTQLTQAINKKLASGLTTEDDVEKIVDLIRDDNPLVERAKRYRLYVQWAKGSSLIDKSFIQSLDVEAKKTLSYFKNDFFAQLKYTNREAVYCGFDSIIGISEGFPRLLLTILKNVYKSALFNDEKPFSDTPISLKSQYAGIKETSDWFFDDARMEGIDGQAVKRAMSNLGEIFRISRFSDKPIECSLISFNCVDEDLSSDAYRILTDACNWSLLISDSDGSRDKNSIKKISKYRLNTILCPRWDLPIGVRGSAKWTARDVEAIITNSGYDEFKQKFKKSVMFPFSLDAHVVSAAEQMQIFDND